MLSAKHNVGKSGRSSKVGQLRPVYRLLLALVAVPILPLYAPIHDALAGAGTEHRSSGQSRVAQSRRGHSRSSRHHAREADHSNETYRLELLRSKSDWKRAGH